ncbi:MAG: copper homeostasis membrane protein CopD [candidate division NC10 bacterium]|nr:copper homeostasis membrane protein CopD [candidate division NC10 bacterium]
MTGLLAFIRAVHLGALVLLMGVFAFLLLVARPAFRKADPQRTPDLERFDRLLLTIGKWSLLATFVSALLWLGLQAALASGQPLTQALNLDTLSGLLSGTQFGRVWEIRIALVALLAGFLFFRDREHDVRDWNALRLEGVLLAGGLMAALAWAGHPAATEGPARSIHLLADTVHMLAAGVWLGGLCPLAVLLRWAHRSPDASWIAVAREATRRFSLLGLVSVSTLTLTGVVNGWILVGSIPPLVGTPYGRLLLLKLVLLLPLVGFAATNVLRLKPALLATAAQKSPGGAQAVLSRLTRNVIAEASLGAAILLIVGGLGITPPAIHDQPSWPFPFRVSWQATQDLPGVRGGVIAGGAGVLLGIGVLAYGLRKRRQYPWVIGLGSALVLCFLAIPLYYLSVDAYPTTYLRTPVPYQAISIASGARLYQQHCTVCHGEAGYGDGPAIRGRASARADLTAPHTALHTAGDLFWWLTHGIRGSPMPGFKDSLTDEERWDLINFLRALAAAEQARAMLPLVEQTPWLVAPDFAYGIGVGEGQTLRDSRGWAIVHLVLFTLPSSIQRLEQLDAAAGKIAGAGARILAVPMRDAAQVYRRLGARAVTLPVAVEGSEEIVETYAMFRRTLAVEGLPAEPAHMEFLVDRQGYIRARWIPPEQPGWDDLTSLLGEIERLDKEAPRAPAPDEHVH